MEAVMRWRRNVVIAAIAVMIASCMFLLLGCSAAQTAEVGMGERFQREWVGDNLLLITDTKEGCQYLFYDGYKRGGLTQLTDKYGYPLLADGYSRREVGMSEDDGE